MRVINLTHGKGNGIDKACLMTASNMLIGKPEDLDNNSCVCPLLRKFIIITNDNMPLKLLRELYTPLIWEILGTRNDDPVILQKRTYCFADWVVRDICNLDVTEIVDIKTALAALAAAHAAAHAAANVANAVYAANYAAYAANAATNAVANAANVANAATNAANAVKVTNNWEKCPEIIRKVAAIGDKRPVEIVLSETELRETLV